MRRLDISAKGVRDAKNLANVKKEEAQNDCRFEI